MISVGRKGQTPWAPRQSALGKRASWARADIQFPFVYAVEGHTVWKRPATYLQIMKAEWDTEVGSASVSQWLPFPLLLLLSTWANDYIHVLWVTTKVTPSASQQGHAWHRAWLTEGTYSGYQVSMWVLQKTGWQIQQWTPYRDPGKHTVFKYKVISEQVLQNSSSLAEDLKITGVPFARRNNNKEKILEVMCMCTCAHTQTHTHKWSGFSHLHSNRLLYCNWSFWGLNRPTRPILLTLPHFHASHFSFSF